MLTQLLFRLFVATAVAMALPCLAMAQQPPKGQSPSDGNTYYIYNVGQRAFLSVNGDAVDLAQSGSAVTVAKAQASTQGRAEATATANLFTMQVGTDVLTLAMGYARGYGEPEEYQQWVFTPAASNMASAPGAYHISCRTLEANALANLYFSKSTQTITSTYLGSDGYADAEWLFVSEDDYKRFVNAVDLRETATSYTAPTLTSGGEADVHLYRKLTVNSWNSFCVPFAIDATQLKRQFGDGVQVGEYTSFGNGNLNFTPVSSIEAGKPYLLRPTRVCDADGYYTFEGVAAFADAPESVSHTDAASGDACTYTASFVSTTAPSRAYVLSKGKLYHLTSDMLMNGFRGYLQTASQKGEAKLSGWTFSGHATSIGSTVQGTVKPDNNIYTIGGQLVVRHASGTRGLPKGMYIVNGRKTVK